ncbi:MAG: hypothetical protein HFJ58_05830 [Clostridia bacterium]|nr:hypothetical protein [Clostridia bacterium]
MKERWTEAVEELEKKGQEMGVAWVNAQLEQSITIAKEVIDKLCKRAQIGHIWVRLPKSSCGYQCSIGNKILKSYQYPVDATEIISIIDAAGFTVTPPTEPFDTQEFEDYTVLITLPSESERKSMLEEKRNEAVEELRKKGQEMGVAWVNAQVEQSI